MTQLFIQLAQTVTGAVFTIVLLLLVAALIGYLTAWFYAKSVYKPIIKGLEDDKAGLIADKKELEKKVDGLKDDAKKLNDTIGKLNVKIASLEKALAEQNSGKFVVSKAKDGQNYFHLKEDGGKTLLSSEMYTTRTACNSGIESVRKNSPEEKRYERLVSNDNRHYFNLKATNGQVIGTSGMYESQDVMEQNIQLVKKIGKTTEIDDTTA
jgi:uncharacterized protein YegP (UPF0339 family)